MRIGTTIISLSAVTLAVSGCGGSSLGNLPIAPYANTYKASYASSTVQKMDDLLKDPGDKVQGLAVPVLSQDTGAGSDTLSNGKPQSVQITKTSDGYEMEFAGQKVAFTQAELVDNDFYRLRQLDSNNNLRTVGHVFSLEGPVPEALSSTQTSMVPLGFGVRVNSEGGPAVEGNDFAHGFAIVGLETNPASMPKTGSATYSGSGRIEARPTTIDWNSDGVDYIRYRGDTAFTADFGSGKVSGTLDLHDRRTTLVQSGNQPTEDITALGAELTLQETDIIQNGFSTTVVNNAAADGLFGNDGISSDTKTQAVGRFYGEDAGQIGAVVTGGGSSHTISGVVYGDRD